MRALLAAKTAYLANLGMTSVPAAAATLKIAGRAAPRRRPPAIGDDAECPSRQPHRAVARSRATERRTPPRVPTASRPHLPSWPPLTRHPPGRRHFKARNGGASSSHKTKYSAVVLIRHIFIGSRQLRHPQHVAGSLRLNSPRSPATKLRGDGCAQCSLCRQRGLTTHSECYIIWPELRVVDPLIRSDRDEELRQQPRPCRVPGISSRCARDGFSPWPEPRRGARRSPNR